MQIVQAKLLSHGMSHSLLKTSAHSFPTNTSVCWPPHPQAAEPASTMQAFQRWFDNVSFKKGTEIAFASHQKGQLVAKVNGQQVRICVCV